MLSILLYLSTGAFWLPVVWIQVRMRDLAAAAARAAGRCRRQYHRLFWTWFAFGFPAFAAVLAIFWLMYASDNTAADALSSDPAQRTSCARNRSSLRYWSARDIPSRAAAGMAGMPAGRCAIQRRSCSAMIDGSLATIPAPRSRII